MKKKYKKRRLKVLIPIAVILLILFIFKLCSYTYRIYNLNNTKNELTEKYISLQKQEKELKIEIEKLKNDEYLAKYVRQKYKYSKDDEIVLSVNETKEVIDKIDKEINNYKVVIIGLFSSLSIVIIYALCKKKDK